MLFCLLMITLIAAVEAVPSITFPINSQVPPVARVSQPFSFVFPESTFYSTASSLIYSLSNAPAWLQLDSASRTFFGTPTAGDVGAAVFNVIATDANGSINMSTTFVVSANPPPALGISTSNQVSSFGTTSGPSSLIYLPSTPFSFTFSPNTFARTSSSLVYYATSADNSPLPSWVNFNNVTLNFSGTTPGFTSLIAPPQTFGIRLIASDILGFEGVQAAFALVVGSHELIFTQDELVLNATKGIPTSLTTLRNTLTLDGQPVGDQDLQTAQAQTLPSWLAFSGQSLNLSGTPPETATSQNMTVTVTDVFGDNATANIYVQIFSSLFTRTIGDLNVTIGKDFNYTLGPGLISTSSAVLSADLGAASSWLKFDTSTLVFQGNPPSNEQPTVVVGNLSASTNGISQSQSFYIRLESSQAQMSGAATSGSFATATSKTSTSPESTAVAVASKGSNRKGVIAVAVIVPVIVFLAILAALICCCMKRRKTTKWERRPLSPSHRNISRPIVQEDMPSPMLEKEDILISRTPSRAPRLSLTPMWKSSTNLRHSKFRRTKDTVDEENIFGSPTIGGAHSKSPRITSSDSQTLDHGVDAPTTPIRPPIPAKDPARSFRGRSSHYSNATTAGLPVSRRVSGVGHGSGLYGSSVGYGIVKNSWRGSNSRKSWATFSGMSGETESTDMLDDFPNVPTSYRRPPEASQRSPEWRTRNSIRSVTTPNPTRLSVGTARQDYIRKRGERRRRGTPSPSFFGYAASRASSHSRVSRMSRFSRAPDKNIPMPSSSVRGISNHHKILQRQETQNSVGTFSQSSSVEPEALRMKKAPRHKALKSRASNGLARRFQTRSSLVSSRKYESADSSPRSRESHDAASLIDVVDEYGRTTWYRKEKEAPHLGRDSVGNIIEYSKDEQPSIEYPTVGVAVSTRSSRAHRLSNFRIGRAPLSMISDAAQNGTQRLKIVDTKGKRPISVENHGIKRKEGGSQRGETAFL
ncbi:MAG: hypothetical protein M1827_005339 [Pycnora praestabilis]|nr:MAG: hypothetical protein M1827_005339 [Pycnora praestabilis]